MHELLRGVVVAAITPMKADYSIDEDAFRTYLNFLAERKVHAVFIAGSTGEGPALTNEERMALTRVAVAELRGRVKVIVHAGHINTADAAMLVRHAHEQGADGAAVLTPWYFGLDEEALLRHYQSVAAAAPQLPIYLYNLPGNARNVITPSLVARLSGEIENIVGLKDSTGDFAAFQANMAAARGEFASLSGSDAFVLAGLAVGSSGFVSGNSSYFPEVFVGLWNAFQQGDLALARRHQVVINRLRLILKDGGHLAYFKAVLAMRGIPVGSTRPPRPGLTESEAAELRISLEQLAREFSDIVSL